MGYYVCDCVLDVGCVLWWCVVCVVCELVGWLLEYDDYCGVVV